MDTLLKVLRLVLERARKAGVIASNPALDVEKNNAHGKHRAWTKAELAAFEKRWPEGSRERLVLVIALNTFQRRGDIAAMTWESVDAEVLHVRQQKTGVEVWLPMRSQLLDILRVSRGGDERTGPLIKKINGGAYRKTSLGNFFTKAVKAAGLPIGEGGCHLHGLRATALTALADAGATLHQIQSVSGHLTAEEVLEYTRAAERKRNAVAAMAMLDAA
jgi:integrase